MPKKLDEELLCEIEEVYLADESQTYASLALRFGVGKSSLERIGKERGWGRKRDQQKARQAQKLLTKIDNATQAISNVDISQLCEFDKRRLLKIVETGLVAFESAFTIYSDNPKLLPGLSAGISKLIEIHVKLKPPTVTDIVEVLIQSDISPDVFLALLKEEQEARKRQLRILKN